MKTFRLIGMALLAVATCVNFTSCGDDDEGDAPIKNEDGIITNQKKLIEMTVSEEDDTNTLLFSYDSKGRLASVIRTGYDHYNNKDITNYTWNNASTIVAEDQHRARTYTLSNGLVRNLYDDTNNDWNNVFFSYNSSGQVIEAKYVAEHRTFINAYTWENGKYIGTNEDDYTDKVTYSGKSCKGYFPLYGIVVFGEISDDVDILYVHPELFGLRNNQLPDQRYYDGHDGYEETLNYTYKLDNDGYVENVIIEDIDKESTSIYTNTTTYYFYMGIIF